jgi:large subunit ribosomal protein L27
MAHIKASGVTKGNRDSQGRRLGVKIYGGEKVTPGNIIIRQQGTKIHPGLGVKMGKDFTIFAVRQGTVKFKENRGDKFVFVE